RRHSTLSSDCDSSKSGASTPRCEPSWGFTLAKPVATGRSTVGRTASGCALAPGHWVEAWADTAPSDNSNNVHPRMFRLHLEICARCSSGWAAGKTRGAFERAGKKKQKARHLAGLPGYSYSTSDQFWTLSSVRRLTSLLQPGRVCAVGSSGRLSP